MFTGGRGGRRGGDGGRGRGGGPGSAAPQAPTSAPAEEMVELARLELAEQQADQCQSRLDELGGRLAAAEAVAATQAEELGRQVRRRTF